MKSFYSGMLGGAILLAIIIVIIMFSMPFHTFNVQIINPRNVDSIDTKYTNKIELIKQMQNEGILLTPQEYTSNIVSYYNTAITILVFLFILFSFLSYFHLKFLSNEQILKIFEEKIQDSKKMEEIIVSAFSGKADDKYETIERVEILRDRLEEFSKKLGNGFIGDDEIDGDKLIINTNGGKGKKSSK